MKLFILLFLLVKFYNCQAYSSSVIKSDSMVVSINSEIAELLDSEQIEIICLWDSTLKSYSLSEYNYPISWSQNQTKLSRYPDHEIYKMFLEFEGFGNCNPIVLSVQKKDSVHILKTAFLDRHKNIRSIYNVVVSKEQSEYKFNNYFLFYKDKYKHTQYKNINYYHHPSYKFNLVLADKMYNFNLDMASFFKTDLLSFDYYIYDSAETMMRDFGYDYNGLMFDSYQTIGLADIRNDVIHSASGDELHKHELVHLYTNHLYYETLHPFFDEGIATLLGGSSMKSLEDQILFLSDYLNERKLDFNNILSNKYLIGDNFNAKYTIAGLVTKIVYQKKGFEGLQELLTSGGEDKDFYSTIQRVLEIDASEFDSYIKKQIKIYSLIKEK